MLPHNPLGPVSTAASVHFGAAVPNFSWLEDNFAAGSMHTQWDPAIFPRLVRRAPTLEQHAALGYPLPTAPGLGVEVDEAYLAAGLGTHQPTGMVGGWRRRDGSLTNA
eukprot:SAG22_NODE_317_length_12513_cov_41.467214_3_plen_108_part_00